MITRDISLKSPEENILFDEVLLQMCEKGMHPEVLRFWESDSYFVVLGRTGEYDDEVDNRNVFADNIPVLRRASGGGTVLQGEGCMNYSVVLSKDVNPGIAGINESYRFILKRVILSLNQLGIDAVFRSISDIAIKSNEKKFSGNAQKRGRKFILHHGTILYDFDLSKIEKYLRHPLNIPEYRAGRSHLEFVDNIAINPQGFKDNMKKSFNAFDEINTLNDAEIALMSELACKRGDIRLPPQLTPEVS